MWIAAIWVAMLQPQRRRDRSLKEGGNSLNANEILTSVGWSWIGNLFLQKQTNRETSHADQSHLVYAINEKIVALERLSYDLSVSDDVWNLAMLSSAAEGGDHLLLKWYAANWCEREYGEWPAAEVNVLDNDRRKHDLWAGKNQILMECGSTAHYDLAFAHTAHVKSFILFPRASSQSNRNGECGVLYRFTPTKDGEEVLERHSKWRRAYKLYQLVQELKRKREIGEIDWQPAEVPDPGFLEPPYDLGGFTRRRNI